MLPVGEFGDHQLFVGNVLCVRYIRLHQKCLVVTVNSN